MRPILVVPSLLLLLLPGLAAPAAAQGAPGLTPEQRQRIVALEQRVRAAFAQGDYAAAEAACREEIGILPTEPSFRYNLACALSRQEKVADAIASLRKCIELGYHDVDHMAVDPDLENVRKDAGYAALVELAKEKLEEALAGPYDEGSPIEGVRTVEETPEGGLRYRLHLPPGASAETPARLLVWLHPSGSSMNRVVEPLAPRFAEKGFALLVPTQKPWRSWAPVEAKRLLEVTIPSAGKRPEVDARKPVLLGYSAGGQMAIELWAEAPGRFGGLILDAAYPLDIPTYQRERRGVPRALPADPAVKTVPILAIVGDLDGGSTIWRTAEDTWRAQGVPLRVVYVTGRRHEWLIDGERLAAVLDWLGERGSADYSR